MVQIENLDFGYRRASDVFKNLGLKLEQGHIYGLLGKNGAGKTTLLKLFAGLLFPKAGKIKIMDQEPRYRRPSLLSEIFFIPEEVTLPDLKMKDYADLIAPFYPRFDFDLLQQALDAFEVSPQVKMNHLSFGQRKKAFISLGIACHTRLLLMDEPTNGLDIPAKSCFRRLLSSIASGERIILISTHQVRDLENLIDALVIIDESRILMNASTEEITERLVFRRVVSGEKALYAEESLQGNYGVVPNVKHESSKLDMEILFSAVLKRPEEIRQIFEI